MVKINKKVLNFFSSLSDETRLKIVMALMDKPMNVGDIHNAIGKKKITLPAISHQLRLLENSNIVVYKKVGREKIFTLSDGFCWCIVRDAFSHFDSTKKHKCKNECSTKNTKRRKV